jgi:hypothetical protein
MKRLAIVAMVISAAAITNGFAEHGDDPLHGMTLTRYSGGEPFTLDSYQSKILGVKVTK